MERQFTILILQSSKTWANIIMDKNTQLNKEDIR